MENTTKNLVNQVLELPVSERISLAEELLKSLDQPDQELDALWANEAESRLDGYESGEVSSTPLSDVFEGKTKSS